MIFYLIIGLIWGFIGGAFLAKFARITFATKLITPELIIAAFSWGSLASYVFFVQNIYGVIGIALGAFITSFVFSENSIDFYRKYSLTLSTCVLVAHFLYNGSERALRFPLMVAGSAFLAYAISAYIIRRKKISSHILTIIGAVYAVVAYVIALFFGADFFPHIHLIGILLAIISSLALIKITGLWKHIAMITLLVLVGYALGDFYNIAIVAATMLGFASINRTEQKSDRTLVGLTLIMLLYVFLRSISLAGRSLLYDLSDPFVIAGLLIGVTLPYLLPMIQRKAIVYASAIILPLLGILILGKIFGTILIAGCVTGLILITLTQGNLIQTAHKENDLEGFVLVFLITMIVSAPFIY